MYIPTTFMSTQGSCFGVTTAAIAGDGFITTGSFYSGSALYDYWKFEMNDSENPALTSFTASFNVLSGSTGQAKVFIVGGGGTGGSTGFINDGSVLDWQVDTTGGGGGGGIVYYDQFPIASGSYTIGIGKATAGPGGFRSTNVITGLLAGQIGQPSWIKLPNDKIYAPFSTPYLVAYGGGGSQTQGWYSRFVSGTRRWFQRNFVGQSGDTSGFLGTLDHGSGGGACTVPSLNPDLIPATNPGMSGGGYGKSGLITYASQGRAGGTAFGGATSPNGIGTGGGGGYTFSGASGASLMTSPTSDEKSKGGDGALFNLTGTPTYFAGGGGGYAVPPAAGITGRGLGDYGCGGNGNGVGSLYNGQAGVCIIAIPRCFTDSNKCTEYRVSGGATGGTITYIPCNSTTLASASIDFGFTGSLCTYAVAGYPTTTGTVSLTATGSCNTFIPLQPTVTCGTGSVKTPVYIWNYTINGTCYPTPSSCQRYFYGYRTLTYADPATGAVVSGEVGLFFSNQPSITGQVCARDVPAPTVTGGTTSKTSLICQYYCSGSV